MIERLQSIETKYNEITSELMKPEVLSDIKRTLELNKEQAELTDVYNAYQEYKRIDEDIISAEEMVNDPEMEEFAKEELKNLNQQKEQLIKDVLDYKDINYAISTMMPNNNVLNLIELVNNLNIPLKLRFSLHTPIDEERKKLIPSTNVNIEEALNYLLKYRKVIQNNKKQQEFLLLSFIYLYQPAHISI